MAGAMRRAAGLWFRTSGRVFCHFAHPPGVQQASSCVLLHHKASMFSGGRAVRLYTEEIPPFGEKRKARAEKLQSIRRTLKASIASAPAGSSDVPHPARPAMRDPRPNRSHVCRDRHAAQPQRLLATFRRDTPARCGAFADERHVVTGDEGAVQNTILPANAKRGGQGDA
jgi:hypothetical protein